MRKTVTRCAVIMVVLFSIILVSFPLFPSTAGIVSNPQLVDRTLKGNRLTNVPAAGKIGSKAQPSFVKALKVSIGCDRVFSSMSFTASSTIFGRCLVYLPSVRRKKFVCRLGDRTRTRAVRCLHEYLA